MCGVLEPGSPLLVDEHRRAGPILLDGGETLCEAFVGVSVLDLPRSQQLLRETVDLDIDPVHHCLKLGRAEEAADKEELCKQKPPTRARASTSGNDGLVACGTVLLCEVDARVYGWAAGWRTALCICVHSWRKKVTHPVLVEDSELLLAQAHGLRSTIMRSCRQGLWRDRRNNRGGHSAEAALPRAGHRRCLLAKNQVTTRDGNHNAMFSVIY